MVVIAFDSAHAAMAAQKLLAGMRFDVIPTPADIAAGCGISLRITDELMEQAAMRLEQKPSVAVHASWHYL